MDALAWIITIGGIVVAQLILYALIWRDIKKKFPK